MKDKRTYTKLKEHGEDMSHENESKTRLSEDRGALDLTFIIEQHRKEIWEYKQKEAEWVKTQNILEGSKKIIDELSGKLIQQVRVIKQLEQEIERLVAENKK